MCDCKTIPGSLATCSLIENSLEVVLGHLNGRELVVIIGVEVKICNDVSQVFQDCLTGCITRGVWWAHVCGVLPNNVANSHLVLNHLVISLGIGYDTQVLMRPSVAGHLMTFGNHTTDHAGPACSRINSALGIVDTGDEECGFKSIAGELMQNLTGIDVRTKDRRCGVSECNMKFVNGCILTRHHR